MSNPAAVLASHSHITPTLPPTVLPQPSNVKRFQDFWSIQSRFQRAMICALGISTGGIWTGQLIGVVDFESRFHVTAILWISDSLLYAGTNNGLLFMINYSPASKHPITMRPILKPLDAPITALALDPTAAFLAIGSSGNTFIFSQTSHSGRHVWDLINHIPAPSEGRHGLVTSLAFYGTTMGFQLFIGHAKEGFCIWRGPDDFQRTPYGADLAVCSIGSAIVSSDGMFIVIVTLEHSVVLYPLMQDGPAIHRRQLIQKDEQFGPRPIVPIALAGNSLVLRGSATGTVPIFDLHNGPLTPIQSDPQEVIRALVTYGNKVVVASSNMAGHASQVKCYLDLSSFITTSTQLEPYNDTPLFEVAIGELEQQPGVFYVWISLWLGWLEQWCKIWMIRLFARLVTMFQCRRTRRVIGAIWILTFFLVVDPPELPGRTSGGFRAQRTQMPFQKSSTNTSVDHVRGFGGQNGHPTLGYLLSYCGLFVASRLMWWSAWGLACMMFLFGCVFGALVYTTLAVPRFIHAVATAAPDFLSAMICEVLLAYNDVSVCPKAD